MKWIFTPDSSTESYWSGYLKNNPSEKQALLSLKEELKNLRMENQDLSELEKQSLLRDIFQKRNNLNIRSNDGRRFAFILKYAAIAIFAFLIGNGLMYTYLQGRNSGIQFAQTDMNILVTRPTLILPDGSDIELQSSSTIDYQKESGLIVDNKQVAVLSSGQQKTSYNQLIIPYGNRSVVTLEDGTKVFLNSGSKLVYPSKFSDESREVFLTGEGYFEVQKNHQKPFFVKTPFLQVKVLGTKFNVSSYSKDNFVQTVLLEGEVQVKRNNAGLFEHEIKMSPNQLIAFNKETNKYETRSVNASSYARWKDGIMVFKDEDFGTLIRRMERFYDIAIEFQDPDKSVVKVSGKLDLNEDKKVVFSYLELLAKIKIDEEPNGHYVIK